MNRAFSLLTSALLLASCAVAGEPPGEGASPPSSTARAPADLPRPAPHTEPVAKPAPAGGEAPAALVANMRTDLMKRLESAGITDPPVVVSSEEVEWPDGGMGCGRPGEMHTMMIIPGYRVVFGAGPRRYAYHASRAGAFKYCDSGARLPPASAGRSNPSM